MTATLPLLIRCTRLTVDERRAELAALAEQEAAAEAVVQQHDAARAAEESGLAGSLPEIRAGYAAWARHHARQRVGLADRHGKLRRSRDSAADALREACAELKRLELAEEACQGEIRRAQARRTEAKAEEVELIRRAAEALPA